LEGDKLDCIAANPTVALSAVTKCAPTVGPKDGSFTLQYKSAMAVRKAEIVSDREEKIEALRAICLRFLPKHMDAFDDAIQRLVRVVNVDGEPSCDLRMFQLQFGVKYTFDYLNVTHKS
jgi:hypothetical protein